MNSLVETQAFLSEALQSDSLLCLAQTVAWLDPLWLGYEIEGYPDADGLLQDALVVTRRHLPDIYAETVHKIRQGADHDALDTFICNSISALGIPLNELDHMPFGIPLPAYGIELNDSDIGEHYPELIPLLEILDINVDTNSIIDIPGDTYKLATILANDLAQRPEKEYRQVAWLLAWLTSITGNSLCDLAQDTLCEWDMLTWDELDFARFMINEAEEVMSDVWAGLDWLNNHNDVLESLKENIQKVRRILKRRKGKDDETLPTVRLDWTDIEYSSERAA